jgi:hypothetical protein
MWRFVVAQERQPHEGVAVQVIQREGYPNIQKMQG